LEVVTRLEKVASVRGRSATYADAAGIGSSRDRPEVEKPGRDKRWRHMRREVESLPETEDGIAII